VLTLILDLLYYLGHESSTHNRLAANVLIRIILCHIDCCLIWIGYPFGKSLHIIRDPILLVSTKILFIKHIVKVRGKPAKSQHEKNVKGKGNVDVLLHLGKLHVVLAKITDQF